MVKGEMKYFKEVIIETLQPCRVNRLVLQSENSIFLIKIMELIFLYLVACFWGKWIRLCIYQPSHMMQIVQSYDTSKPLKGDTFFPLFSFLIGSLSLFSWSLMNQMLSGTPIMEFDDSNSFRNPTFWSLRP